MSKRSASNPIQPRNRKVYHYSITIIWAHDFYEKMSEKEVKNIVKVHLSKEARKVAVIEIRETVVPESDFERKEKYK